MTGLEISDGPRLLVRISESMVNWSASNKGAWVELETLDGSRKLVRTFEPLRSDGELHFQARDQKGHVMKCKIQNRVADGVNAVTVEVDDWGEDIPIEIS